MKSSWKYPLYISVMLLVVMAWWWYNRPPRFTEDHVIAAALAGDDRLLTDILDQQPGLLRVRSTSGGADLMLLAARSGNAVCIDLLAHRGLRADGKDRHGQDAIDHLAESTAPKRGEAWARLEEAGARSDPKKIVALLLSAAQRGDPEMITALVKRGTPITSTDERGWTVLHAAMSVGDRDFVEYLLKEYAPLRLIRVDGNALNATPGSTRPE
jgi:ankyrin repeat protein